MHTKQSLLQQLDSLNIRKNGTLLVHSSMKSIGEVEGGADTVLDVLSTYMKDGLLVLPTHTWSYIKADNPIFHAAESPSCVGILTELFRQRPGVVRSLHPTHSVAALGKDAEAFVAGDEHCDTPCGRNSVWGRLLDRHAQIMLLGVDLRRNTFIHGIEEWCDIPGRLTEKPEQLYTVLPDGTKLSTPQYRHSGHWSEQFYKVDDLLVEEGAMHKGTFGDAEVRICDAKRTYEVIAEVLRYEPDIFAEPVVQA